LVVTNKRNLLKIHNANNAIFSTKPLIIIRVTPVLIIQSTNP